MSEEPSRPGLDTLADYLEGLLSEAENREVERWVTEDATTAELLHELERLPGLLAADPVGPTSSHEWTPPWPSPSVPGATERPTPLEAWRKRPGQSSCRCVDVAGWPRRSPPP